MIKDGIDKIKILLKRRKNARKLKIDFTRAAKWQMPKTLLINQKVVQLHLVDAANSNAAFIDVLLDDTYGLEFFKSRFGSIKNILDIGANQGLFILAARNMFPQATIHSYEPNGALIPSLNHHSAFAVTSFFIEAVGRVNGRIKLQNDSGDSLMTKTVLTDEGTIRQVAISTCLERMGGEVDLLKLDCEGAEWEILKDTETLKSVKAITLEYHLDNEHDHKSILSVLQAANFKIISYGAAGPTWGMAWAINKLYDAN